MQGRKYSIIGFLLFMTVMFTGMCFENIKTDSFFAYVWIEESSLRLVVPDESVDNEQLCTI